ncbi:transposase [Granulicella sp. 5B5]|nr:transposase [Granulicella sp. 5B5]
MNGAQWAIRSGIRWANLPERYAKYKSVHKRFVRWTHAGVWDRIFAELVRNKQNPYLMLDSTIVKAHQQAAGGRKKGRQGSGEKPRRADDQDPSAGQRRRTTASVPPLGWTTQ